MNLFLKRISTLIFTLVIFLFLAQSSFAAITCSTNDPCWIPKATMQTPRRDFGVATDASGKIYVVGGLAAWEVFTPSLEMYDPSTNTWTTKAPAPVGRNDMGFIFNPANGKFYFGGGYNDGLYNDFFEYNPTTDSWTTKASMPTASIGVSFAVSNGKVYAIGGSYLNGFFVTNVEEYDPSTDQWTIKSAIPHPQGMLGLVTESNGKIVVIGGGDANDNYNSKFVDEYDPINDTWTSRNPMPNPRSDFAISLNSAGNVYVIGGSDNNGFSKLVEEYNLTTDTWVTRTPFAYAVYAARAALGSDNNVYFLGGETDTWAALRSNHQYTTTTPSVNCSGQNPCWSQQSIMSMPRRDLGLAADTNGHVYVAGGYTDVRSVGLFTTDFEMYDTTTDSWTQKADVPVGRNDMGFVFNPANGKFYFGGGYNEGMHSEFFEYDPTTNVWTQKQSLPDVSLGLKFAAANGKIYSIGGANSSYIITNVYEYNPTTDTWTTKSAIPTPRANAGVVTAPNGKIYLIGGGAATGSITDVEEYDPVNDTWTQKSPLSVAREDLAASLNSNGNIYAIGGANGNGYTDSVEEYNIASDTWTTRTPFPYPVYAMGLTLASNGMVYGVGGQSVNDPTINSVYKGETSLVSRQLTTLDPAKIWVGLKNSDDVGVKFDLKAEAYVNGNLISTGETNTVLAGSSGFNNAKLDTINFNSFSPVDFPSGSTLSIKLYVRNACTGSGHNSGVARLWYNDSAANSRFGATIDTSNTYYLVSSAALSTNLGSGPKQTVDVQSGAKCSAFKTFGTWNITP